MTAISLPMVHDTIPLLKHAPILKPQLPYLRLPGVKKIKRNEIVVFSWPADTVRQFFVKEKRVDKPIDKKSNYVKRCVGVPGDTLEILNGFVYTNDSKIFYRIEQKFSILIMLTAKKESHQEKLSSKGYSIIPVPTKLITYQRKYIQANITIYNWKKGNTIEDFRVITEAKVYQLN